MRLLRRLGWPASLLLACGLVALSAAEAGAGPEPVAGAATVQAAVMLVPGLQAIPGLGSGQGLVPSADAMTVTSVPLLNRIFGPDSAAGLRRAYSYSPAGAGAAEQQLSERANEGATPFRIAGGALQLGAERVFELNWPDDNPRSYLEPAGPDLYRRVQLASKEGYEVSLRSVTAGDMTNVMVRATRRALSSPQYDASIGRPVGKPTLVRTVCTTTVPVAPGTAALLTWPAGAAPHPAGLVAPDLQGTALPGLVVTLAQAGAAPLSVQVGYDDAGETGGQPAAPLGQLFQRADAAYGAGARANLMGAGKALQFGGAQPPVPPVTDVQPPRLVPAPPQEGAVGGASVDIECKLVDVPVLAPEWQALTVDGNLQAALERLIAQGTARVIATPRVVAFDNQTSRSTLLISQDGVAVGGGKGGAPIAPSGTFPLRLDATPELLADGNVSVVLETYLSELLDKVDAGGPEANPVGAHSAGIRIVVPDGGTGIVGGLLRVVREGGEGDGTRRPLETFVLVTPRVVNKGGQTVEVAEGVRIARVEPGVNADLISPIAQIVAAAKKAMEATFPDRPLDRIGLVFAPARAQGHENVVTDRRRTIYIRSDRWGIGELFRPDAGPVAILCEAVAELYNPRQVAGFNRFVAHRYLVPAVAAEVPPDFLDDHRMLTPLAPDGPEMLRAMGDPLYSRVHPDFAAVAALNAVEQRLHLDGLRALLRGNPDDAADPFAALREAAVREAPQLAEAFSAYDGATRLEVGKDGSCLIASFEPNETIREAPPLRTATDTLLLTLSPQNRWSLSKEWATDGGQSLKVEADEGAPWMSVVVNDADWQFKDWRRFSEFSFDFLVESPEPQTIFFCAQDHPTCGHGCLVFFDGTVQPGEAHHVSFPLNEESLRGLQDMDSTYFSGAFRADSVSRIYIGLNKPTQPITLYLDNLRLKVRPN